MRAGRHILYFVALFSGVSVGLTALSTHAGSQTKVAVSQPADITPQAAKRQINIAGRQAMFSQKIAALVCLAELGRASDAKGIEVLQLRWFFRRTLTAFRDGDPILGIVKQTSPGLLKHLEEIEATWKIKADSMDNWSLFFSSAVPEIYELSQKILDGAEAVVKDMERTYRNDQRVSAATLTALRLVGRQRTLSQRIAKELCLVHSDYKADQSRAQLKVSVDEFEKTMTDLANGSQDLGLEKPPSMIQDQLALTAKEYAPLKEVIDKVLNSETLSKSDLDIVEQQSTKVLLAVDEAVYVYEQLN